MKSAIIFKLIFVVLLLSTKADAHVTVEPTEAKTGSYAKLTFRVAHGCDGSPTNKITVKIPDGFLLVKPQVHHSWKIDIKKEKLLKPKILHGAEITEVVRDVSWSGSPLPDDYMEEFGMTVKLPDQTGSKLLIPVVQECKKGMKSWDTHLGLLQ